jgi:hypothetical protein
MKAFIYFIVYIAQFAASPIYLYLVGNVGVRPFIPTVIMIGCFLTSVIVYEFDAYKRYRGSNKTLFLVLLLVFHVVVAPYYWFTNILRKE